MTFNNDYDDELTLFLQEIHEEQVAGRLEPDSDRVSDHALIMSGETRFDIASLHKMVRNRNEMVQLLREFLALHPEETTLTRRARRFTGQRKQQ